MTQSLFDALLLIATLSCSLVAGFLFAFAVVVMPGIGRMDDASFIRAFQAIDRVIQNRRLARRSRSSTGSSTSGFCRSRRSARRAPR